MKPKVSICVPNLNTRPFLPERFRTIADQSLTDWELLVYDSFSDDGAWEYIGELAAREPRMRAWQGPREGTPGSWNPCIREARGEYVYIATSDDTMPPDCLEKLAAALDAHPDCDLAHAPLMPIDEHGRMARAVAEWWAGGPFAASSGALLHELHVRRAPFDGLLHLLGGSVYTSITQLLIRRSLFDRIGGFESTWGSVGDFVWSMKAGLVAHAVHVPDTWGGWRLHGSQATAGVTMGSKEHDRKIDEMIEHAIASTRAFLDPDLGRRLAEEWAPEALELRIFSRTVAGRRDRPLPQRAGYTIGRALAGSAPARHYMKSRLLRRPLHDWAMDRLQEAGVGPILVPVGAGATGHGIAQPVNRETRP
jgi:hypothetical protein